VIKEQKTEEVSGQDETTARNAQHAVNVLRKAKTHVTKITREQQEKSCRFAKYETRLMAAYVAVKKRHEEYQDKLAGDLVEAQQHVLVAKASPAGVAKAFATGASTAVPQAMEVQGVETEAWSDMLRRHAVSSPPALEPELLEVLRLYKSGALRALLSATQSYRRRCPTRNAEWFADGDACTGQPWEASYYSAGTGLDAPWAAGAEQPTSQFYYSGPPSGAHLRSGLASYCCAALGTLPAQLTYAKQGRRCAPRCASGDAGPSTCRSRPDMGGTSLEAKLEKKRAVERGLAMQPFRRQAAETTDAGLGPVEAGALEAQRVAQAIAYATLVEDDPDLDSGTRSPGLAKGPLLLVADKKT
ncbi:unnamed protein product, partial [Symbiodinium sp. CCMP2592]